MKTNRKCATCRLEGAALVGWNEVAHLLSPDHYFLLATVVAVEDAGSPIGFADKQRIAANE